MIIFRITTILINSSMVLVCLDTFFVHQNMFRHKKIKAVSFLYCLFIDHKLILSFSSLSLRCVQRKIIKLRLAQNPICHISHVFSGSGDAMVELNNWITCFANHNLLSRGQIKINCLFVVIMGSTTNNNFHRPSPSSHRSSGLSSE